MLAKSLKIFFKNPLITLPNILFLLIFKIFLDWYLNASGLNSAAIAENMADTADIQKYATLIAVFLLVLILAVFITALTTSWTYIMCKYAVDGQPVKILGALKEALKYYWRMLGVIVLISAIFFGIAIIVVITFIPLAMSIQGSVNIAAVTAMVVLFLIFLLGIMFLSICFKPVQIALVYDNLGIGESISKGFKFGLKKFFPILGVLLLVVIASLIINLPLEYILNASSNTILSYIPSIVSTYFSIITVVYVMYSYKNNKPQEAAAVPEQTNIQDINLSYGNQEEYKNYDINEPIGGQQEENTSEGREDPPEEKSNFRI